MKVMSVSSLDHKGEPNTLACAECKDQARLRYILGGVEFSLCLLCVMKLEKLTANILASFLEMRLH